MTTYNDMNFRRPIAGDMVCCCFQEGNQSGGEVRHVSAVVITAYSDGDCLLVAPNKDGLRLDRLTNMPFSTGASTPSWHWPRKPTGCPSCEE